MTGTRVDKKSAKFKKLQSVWYKKLEKEGFKDIEQDEDKLLRWDSFTFIANYTNYERAHGERKLDATWFAAKEEYFQLATDFLHEHKFNSEKDRLIWEMHSNGAYISEIYRELTSRKMKVYLDGINKIVKTLSKLMLEQKCQYKKT